MWRPVDKPYNKKYTLAESEGIPLGTEYEFIRVVLLEVPVAINNVIAILQIKLISCQKSREKYIVHTVTKLLF